ncbi:M14 family zinc carboxypeptidase [Lewinella sp. W8]|uniref:M14 family zinc carboxypeptidase n=1 Tax=Lewinella sp. W8 TaxID=2528208 RepID=UPI001068A7E3|nr:M14 family zinc carboxypeptidase [Lewinella sp. W8]MTB50071.1 hypothetical protein [Lewinella sp. W8]
MKRLPLLLLLLLPILGFAQPPASIGLDMATSLQDYDGSLIPPRAYPTYELYERIMTELAARYPDNCALEEWGVLPSGHRILTLRITKNVRRSVGKPQVLLTAAMHGDETAGYWLMLKLAEHLLRAEPGRLLEDTEIFINPLANPDGAFPRGGQSLAGSRRGNSQGVDLNRNYPDPDDGAHPDDYAYQPETRIFMEAARRHSFDLALNLHGGAEVFNYPWDTYRQRHADNDWWRRISRDFASRAQTASGNGRYFQGRHQGVTNGHDWYPIAGSRQDYMNYYHRCREATLEVTKAKRFPARELPSLWKYTRTALLGYLNEARRGVHGYVVDANTGKPLKAHVSIPGHDYANSDVFTDPRYGNFYRFLSTGTYQLQVSSQGYETEWVSLNVKDTQRTDLRIELRPRMKPTELAVRKR